MLWFFSVSAIPPPPQLQSTCDYIVNHCVKIWHMCRGGGGANKRPLSLGAQTEKDPMLLRVNLPRQGWRCRGIINSAKLEALMRKSPLLGVVKAYNL